MLPEDSPDSFEVLPRICVSIAGLGEQELLFLQAAAMQPSFKQHFKMHNKMHYKGIF